MQSINHCITTYTYKKLLGHSSIGITKDVYGHLDFLSKVGIARKFNELPFAFNEHENELLAVKEITGQPPESHPQIG